MNIKDVIDSQDPIIAEIGTKAFQLKNAFEQGTITKLEYEELVEDLIDVKRIEKLARSVKHKALLADVFKIVAKFLTSKI